MQESVGVFDFAGIGELSETTTQLLAVGMMTSRQSEAQTDAHDRVKQFVVHRARDYLSEVREGFALSVRTADVSNRSELGYLLERILTDWGELSRELELDAENTSALTDSDAIERVRGQLLAFGMAATALGFLPRLPTDRITFPFNYNKPPTYADIAPPDSPGEMLRRIEEVEYLLWEVLAGSMRDLVRTRYGALRRTYGFFEANALLAGQEVERFGIKGRRTRLSLL